jgi:hypothetical protein
MIIETDRDPRPLLELLRATIFLNKDVRDCYRAEGKEDLARERADHVMEYTAWFNIINNAWCGDTT